VGGRRGDEALTADEITSEIRRILGIAFKRTISDNERPDRQSEARWDSLKHIEIIFMLEDCFEIEFPAEEIAMLNSLDALVKAVERYRAA
jgi:acyl carrier protein